MFLFLFFFLEVGGNRAVKKSKFKNILLERIPCPIDPSHSIYKHNLLLHSKICNIRTRQLEMREEAFYCLNCNSGGNSSSSDKKEIINGNNNNDVSAIENDNILNTVNSTYVSATENDVTVVANDDVITCIVNPDLLLIKIKECYLRLEESAELSFLKNNFKNTKECKSENRKSCNIGDISDYGENNNENANKNEIIISESKDGSNNENTIHTVIVKSAIYNTHSISDESYELLENRVVSAVSGDQVAFDRVRHAQQDAMIVR